MMGGPRPSMQVLLLLTFGIVCMSSLASTNSNNTQGPSLQSSDDRIASTSRGVPVEFCAAANLRDAGHNISVSVDTLFGQLSCKQSSNASLPDAKSREVEENLRWIVESTAKVLAELGAREAGFDLMNIFGVLESLRLGNSSDPTFIKQWFSLKMAPLVPYVTESFLMQLGKQNFSCASFQELIKAFSIRIVFMNSNTQQAVYTHLIKPFLSRNDSSDPGCVSFVGGTQAWLQINLGNFSVFATLQELSVFNFNFSSTKFLSELAPTELAQTFLSLGSLNFGALLDDVFKRLEVGNILENVDGFFSQLKINGQVPEFTPVVRDRMMDRTFTIISPRFQFFKKEDFFAWFHVKLVSILPSFSPEMLINVTSGINCTNYHIVVGGMAKIFSAIPTERLQRITKILLNYLTKPASVINAPECRLGIQNDTSWVEINLGPFSQFASYFELSLFNLSQVTILDSLSSRQKANFLLESNNLFNQTLVTLVFTRLAKSASLIDLGSFFEGLVNGTSKLNVTVNVQDVILNLTLTTLSPFLPTLNAEGFKLWFQVYLPSYLPRFDSKIFEIIPRNITCNSYQEIIKGFSNIFSQLSGGQTQQVLSFTLDYLRKQLTSGLSCVEPDTDDKQWMERNFGQYYLQVSFLDFLSLKKNFRGVDVANLLTLSQLSQLIAIPTQLTAAQDVKKIMAVIKFADFAAFFNNVSAVIEAQGANYSQEVKSAFLQAVFDKGVLTSPDASDQDFLLWLKVRLRPLLFGLSPELVKPLFSVGTNRNCNSSQEMITFLDTLQKSLSTNTQKEIYNNIVLLFQGPGSLKCYSGGSYYIYLRTTFLSFGFPDLPTFVSFLPPTRKSELISTFSTSELRQFLSQPSVINNSSGICDIFNNYNKTATFLETEDVPDGVKAVILPCVWHLALRSSSRIEVDSWFNLRLKNYLRFLNKNLISSTGIQESSCFGFQRLVSFMGNSFTYNASEFGQAYVYTSIKSYLRVGSGARCYNSSNPELNSTSWFANYIGSFVTFITLEDLTSFVSTTQIAVFLEDQANLELFNNTAIPETVTSYYITQLFTFNPSFKTIQLPGSLLCSFDVPSFAYSSLKEADAIAILNKRRNFCSGLVNPEVFAALATNFKTITSDTFVNLGNACSGLTISQITSVSSVVLKSSLSVLGSVTTWGRGQVNIIIQTLSSSDFLIDSGSKLESLGTLVAGVPAAFIEKITASSLLSISISTSFVSNMLTAPKVVMQTFVKKIISVDTSPAKLLLNVPDAMATEIPPFLLVFSETIVNIAVINKKTWTRDQSTMFFGNLGKIDVNTEDLSPFVLQGFTCTSADKMTKTMIRQLIRASRPRRGRAKVELMERQLTCMYNLLRGDLSQNFTDYPSEMLLYFRNTDIQKSNCRSYFSALGAADFSVASAFLNKSPQLFSEATACLGINGTSLSKDDLEVLGNMLCSLDGSYIKNSDPLILENLKACKDFSESQVAAIESLLLSGKTKYGDATAWNKQTLEELGNLPLYFTRNIWGLLNSSTKKRFLKVFMSNLRKIRTQKTKLKRLFKEISSRVVKRAAGCTEGNITQVTVSDDSFPFGYDQTQFDLCLDVPVLKDNLDSICEKVDDDNLQKIILKKLNEAYPSGVPDEKVQLLGSVSRVASLDDISKWSITRIDTLAALMVASDGTWETAKIREIITKYLNTSGNSLGSTELNIIDSYLCSLSTSTIKTISSDSIRNANPLNVGTCSLEQKRVLYEISNSSISSLRSSSTAFYNLIKGYLGGAPLVDIVALSTQNISMDVDIFRSLEPNVVTALTVTNVQGLMGSHVPDLKLFENDPLIRTWINLQFQSELDRLDVGLISNRTSSTAAPLTGSSSATTQNATTSSATKVKTNIFGEKPAAFIFLSVLLTAVL